MEKEKQKKVCTVCLIAETLKRHEPSDIEPCSRGSKFEDGLFLNDGRPVLWFERKTENGFTESCTFCKEQTDCLLKGGD